MDLGLPSTTTIDSAVVRQAADALEAAEAEVARLTAENFALASWQCPFTDGKAGLVCDESGGQFCQMHRRAEAAEAEVVRLRKALEPFAPLADEIDALRHSDDSTCLHRIKASDLRRARAALDGMLAKERERCATLAEDKTQPWLWWCEPTSRALAAETAKEIAAAIRARVNG